MPLTDERKSYYTKLIKDYEEFLLRPHPPEFYAKVIVFRDDATWRYKNTNEGHILKLIADAKEALEDASSTC